MANKVWRDWEKTLYEPGENHIGNGENYDDIVNRADKALSFLVNHKSNTLVVVTHGHFLRAIVARVLFGDNLTGKIMRQFQERASMENTGITVLIYKDAFEEGHSWRLWTYNDHSHFAE
jgi:broad specificity phosphatase PhoE